MRWKRSELAGVLAALLLAGGADAAVRRFDLTTDASSNAEGELELEGWLDFGKPPQGATSAMAWLGLRFGLLDSLELASFLVLEKSELAEPPRLEQSGLMMWLTELRWRPVEVGKWPVDLFLGVQLMHWFEPLHPIQFRFTLGVSRIAGRFLFAGNFSYWESLEFQNAAGRTAQWRWLEVSVGVSTNLIEADGWVPSTNLGVEAWSLIQVIRGTLVHSHLLSRGGFVVGPTVSLARGRLWVTGHVGVPLYVANAAQPFGFSGPLVGRFMLGINL